MTTHPDSPDPLSPGSASSDGRPGDRLGSVEVAGDTVLLRYERLLRHDPARVWLAMTTSGDLREWMPCDLVGELRPGAEVLAVFWPDIAERHGLDPATFACRILASEPEQALEWEWGDEVVRFDLEPTGDGHTLLRLEVRCGPGTEPPAESVAAGYHICLTALAEHLDGVAHPPFVDRDSAPMEATYRELLRSEA